MQLMKKKTAKILILLVILLLAACNARTEHHSNADENDYLIADDALANYELYTYEDKAVVDDAITLLSQTIFTSTVRIHEDMPEFTFHRIINEIEDTTLSASGEGWHYPAFDVSIIIYDENENLIQEITGLHQTTTPYNSIDDDWMQISFIDLNFDGYLDMRLFGTFHSERWPGWGQHYHWIWDSKAVQFVFNEQLTEFLATTQIMVDEESRTWSYGWSENAGLTQIVRHFGFANGEFIEIRRENFCLVQLNESNQYDGLDDLNEEIWIHIDVQDFTDAGQNIYINISDRNGYLMQEIHLVVDMGYMWTAEHNFHLADYNGDGYLDMAIRRFHGGSMGNDPHYYWLWDAALRQFVLNETLTDLSDFTSIIILPDGNLQMFHRDGQWSLWLTHEYIDDDFVLILSEEHETLLNGKLQITVHDRISGEIYITTE